MTTTPAPLADLDRARNIALDLSGWGRRFSLYQPRNFAFWGYLVLVGTGIFVSVSRVTREYDAYGQAIALAVTSFAIYAALFWWFTQRIDHYAKLPAKLMVVAFLWGGFAATWMMAASANDAILALYAKSFGQSWALNWGAGLSAPFTLGSSLLPKKMPDTVICAWSRTTVPFVITGTSLASNSIVIVSEAPPAAVMLRLRMSTIPVPLLPPVGLVFEVVAPAGTVTRLREPGTNIAGLFSLSSSSVMEKLLTVAVLMFLTRMWYLIVSPGVTTAPGCLPGVTFV